VYAPEPQYPNYFRILPVNSQGTLYVDGELKYLSSALADERIGMEEADDGVWNIYFCKERLARYDERTRRIER
jgi:hypothetical protein